MTLTPDLSTVEISQLVAAPVAVPDVVAAPQQSSAMAIIGHRGSCRIAPENSLASVRLAWEENAAAVEVDVHLTKDGRIVVIHDESTARTCGLDRLVREQTLAELQSLDFGRWKAKRWAGQRISTLDDVLATIPDGKRLFIEVKCGQEIATELQQAVRRSGRALAQVAVIGFSLEMLQAVKRKLPDVRAYWVVEQAWDRKRRQWLPGGDELADQAKAAGLDGLDLRCGRAVNPQTVSAIKQAGLEVYVWTVNSVAEARRMQSLGIDGVTTDRPGWLRARLAQPEPAISAETAGAGLGLSPVSLPGGIP